VIEVSLMAALLAGALSFLSPCVLPIVPGYLAFLAGADYADLAAGAARRRLLAAGLAFVLGFGTVFVLLGAAAVVAGSSLAAHADLLGRLAGAVIIVLGLHVAGVFRLPFLAYEARFHPAARPAGLFGAFAVGLAFAFGWTPCVGPVLASILLVAGTGESAADGILLLVAYAAGLGIPFLLAAALAPLFLRWSGRFRRHLRVVEAGTGALLVATGILILAGAMGEVAALLLDAFPALGRIG
jgi:cytochrome c-type biogenesis protein